MMLNAKLIQCSHEFRIGCHGPGKALYKEVRFAWSRDLKAFALVCLLSLPVFCAASFDAGAEAYRRSDFVGAFEILEPLAEQGDARAQNVIALMYKYGEGVDQDLDSAFSWYHKAAELGYAPAQFNVGDMLANGRGTVSNRDQAIVWLTRAAQAGFDRANDRLAELNVNPVQNKPKGLAAWSKSWDLQLPNDIRFATAKPSLADNTFRIQLGAMSTREKAVALRNMLLEEQHEMFRDLVFSITEARPRKTVFRIQAGPFSSIQDARRFCDQLLERRAGSGCLALQPDP